MQLKCGKKSERAVCVAAFRPTARVLPFAVNPQTSVEGERAFSAAVILCSRLSDATLDTLCFLRSYYCN